MIIYEADMDEYGNILEHYGRKGMKWGQNIFTVKDGKVDFNSTPGGGGGADEEEEEKGPENEFDKIFKGLKGGSSVKVNPLLEKVDKESRSGGGFSSTKNSKNTKKGKNFVSKIINGIKKLNKITVYKEPKLEKDRFHDMLPKKKKK